MTLTDGHDWQNSTTKGDSRSDTDTMLIRHFEYANGLYLVKLQTAGKESLQRKVQVIK